MLIAADEFNSQVLYEVYKNAYMSPAFDDDGDVELQVEDLHLYVAAPPDRPFLILRTGFRVKPAATREQCLELCNRINDHMILIRCSAPEGMATPAIVFDHFTMTAGGITAEGIVALTRRFARVVREGVREYDGDDIVC